MTSTPAHTIDYFDHPVFNLNSLVLETHACHQLGQTLRQWLWTGSSGGVITGASRVGKTTAIRHLMTTITQRNGAHVPSAYVSIPRRDRPNIVTVFRQLCLGAGLKMKRHEPADHLSDRFVHFLADQAVRNDSRHSVLIVDEMQRLKPRQFEVFAELYDKLGLLGIALTVIFVGNDPECRNVIHELDSEEYAHIRGRFFVNGGVFMGLVTKRDVKFCLEQFDQRHHLETGPSYTEFFVSEARTRNWKYAALSSAIWDTFRHYQKAYGFESWPMKYFMETITTLLVDYLSRFGADAFSEEMVHECIRVSGLLPSLVVPD